MKLMNLEVDPKLNARYSTNRRGRRYGPSPGAVERFMSTERLPHEETLNLVARMPLGKMIILV